MNSTLIATLSKHKIYLISDDKITCLIGSPIKDTINETSISLEFKSQTELDKLDYNKNDQNWVNDNITRIYKNLDNYNITLVIPLFSEEVVKEYLINQNEGVYPELSKLIIYLINNIYTLIKSLGVNVKENDIVNIISSKEYVSFVNWFVGKCPNRIKDVTLGELLEKSTPTPYKKIETPDMNFVIGKTTIPHEEAQMIATQNIPITYEEPTVKKLTKQENSGFVGYYLLSFLVIIVCFIFLYIIL